MSPGWLWPGMNNFGIDTLSRTLGRELGTRLGHTVITENVPGAGGRAEPR